MSLRLTVVFSGAVLLACASPAAEGEPESSTVALRDTTQCVQGDKTRERHGTDCLCCHTEFGVAGSIERDTRVDWVLLTDSEGRYLQIAPNPHDNFFRHAKLRPPIHATLVFADGTVRTMKQDAPHGSCNQCHGATAPGLGAR